MSSSEKTTESFLKLNRDEINDLLRPKFETYFQNLKEYEDVASILNHMQNNDIGLWSNRRIIISTFHEEDIEKFLHNLGWNDDEISQFFIFDPL